MADIRHLVVLMLENRSFDHMLGYLKAAGMDIDGPTLATNVDDSGNAIRRYHLDSTRVRIRPHHEHENVVAQVNGGKMDGFLKGYGSSAHLAEIMGFYDPPASPANEAPPFDRFGVRVPAIVVSPWVPRGVPFHGTLDHTCIARTALELFAPEQVNQLSARVRDQEDGLRVDGDERQVTAGDGPNLGPGQPAIG